MDEVAERGSVAPRPVILLHGLFGSLDLPELIESLDGFDVAAPDLPGYGRLQGVPPRDVSLESQRDFVADLIGRRFDGVPCCLVGHSVGGAVAMLVAHRHPDLVAAVVNIEGNFTLQDAFWSARLSRLPAQDAEAELRALREDPATWIARSIPRPSASQVQTATRWLSHQPASTLQAMGRSIVATTGAPGYLSDARAVFARHPVTLVAGERSVRDWDMPAWARTEAADVQVLAHAGHLVPLERPRPVARIIARAATDG